MKFKKAMILGLLGGAMLAMPIATVAFADPPSSANSGYILPVDWWWDHYQNDHEAYVNHGWHKGYYEYSGKRYACDRARGLQSQVWQDRRSGHPAAAQDVEAEAAAARARCYSN